MNDLLYQQIMEEEMREALENGEFHLYLQPKVNMITKRVHGAEVLSRWIHPVDGLRGPVDYIPVMEENGFIVQLDMYMFEQLCILKQRWHREDVEFASIPISVNMSRHHLFRDTFVDELVSLTKKYQVSPSEIEIEITESIYLNDNTELIHTVDQLKKHGFYVSIDDFGSGYSSLSMLKDIPADTIKIDKEFLELSSNSERGKRVIKNVIRLCKDLKFKVMTEGVENQEQADILTSYGCEVAQGFYYSRPIPIDAFEAYTREHYVVSVDVIQFAFENNLKSDKGRFEGEFTGKTLSYVKGITPTSTALHFEGGLATENLVSLPTSIIHNDSYSVSMWIKVDKLSVWTATVFGEYENGFFQFCPVSDYGQACFRIRDRRQVDGWHDALIPTLEENKWYHIVITYDSASEEACVYVNGELGVMIEEVPALYFLKRLYVGGDIYKPTFEGDIDEVVFYDRALTASDVVNLYSCYVLRNGFDAQ